MKDIQTVYDKCANLLATINCPVRKPQELRIVKNVRRLGRCCYGNASSSYIELNAELLQDNVPDTLTENTMIHEMLHTIIGGHGHTGDWKVWANIVNYHFPQYNITRLASAEECEAINHTYNRRERTHWIGCPTCGWKRYMSRVTDRIKHPEHFRCRACHTDCISDLKN